MAHRRRRYRSKPKNRADVKKPPTNTDIDAPEVRLVGVEGEQLGVVSTQEARNKAAELEMDLVMVAQKASPPVVRIMNVGKHLYEQRKKLAKQKAGSKGGDVKGVRVGFKIGDHDKVVRLRQADGFLEQGHKVKIEMRLRGREKGRVDMAVNKIEEFIKEIPGGAKLEDPVSRAGGNLSAVVTRG
jgi:translation initiation factor IF-3